MTADETLTPPDHRRGVGAGGVRWAVVGGGMLGMTLSLRLRQAGHQVTLYERSPHLGGLASTWQLGDVTWDRHYHVILRTDEYLLALLDELGLQADLVWEQTRTGCYTDGVLYSVSSTTELLRFPPLRLVDKLRLGATVLYASRIRDWRQLERITAAEWLRGLSGDRAVEQFWMPLLRAKLGSNAEQASAAFIWAVIQRLYAARSTGAKREQFGHVRGGYARVLERLGVVLDSVGVDVRLGASVQQVDSTDSGPVVRTDEGEERFEQVVVTTASPIAARLLPTLKDTERRLLEEVRYQGIVCASLLLSEPLSPYYVTNITDDSLPFTGVIDMTALVDPGELNGHGLVYLPRYVVSDDPFLQADEAAIRELFVDGLRRIHPQLKPDQIEAFAVSRVRYVLPVPTIGYSERVPAMTTSLPGVYTASSAQIVNGTLNVNETLRLAERALAHIAPTSRPVVNGAVAR
jgi:protoporphyrinogen oxidase